MRDASWRELAAAGNLRPAERPGKLGGGRRRACIFKVPEARGRCAEGRRGGATCLPRTAPRLAQRSADLRGNEGQAASRRRAAR